MASVTLRRMSSDRLEIREARREDAQAALELLLAESAPAERAGLATELFSAFTGSSSVCSGLYVVTEGEQLVGAGWGQRHQGRTGSVWRPRFLGADIDLFGARLTRLSADWLAARDLRLLQSLVAPHDATAARWLTECGFVHVTRLGYLVWNDDYGSLAEPSLCFKAASPDATGELAQVVEQSYIGTLDCPALNELRSTSEVFEGYQEVGQHWPEAWLIAWRENQPVGCLILADHPASNQGELVYMGIVPECRGQGLSGQIVQRAKQLLRERGRARLVLAVDLQNAPAIRLYDRQGFRLWDERDVFVRRV